MFLAAGHYRGRVQTTTMKICETLADAWAHALKQETVRIRPQRFILARIWQFDAHGGAPKLLKADYIQKQLGLPIVWKYL